MYKRKLAVAVGAFLAFTQVKAQIRLPKVIGSNMVLQRNVPLPIWGWACPGENIKVQFLQQSQNTVADSSGYWKVVLQPLAVLDKPAEMTIAGNAIVTLSNILVGEVWLCSGQSNMEYTMKLMKGYTKPAKGADSCALEINQTNSQIRLFTVEKVVKGNDVVTTGWSESNGEALEKMSAAGYFFAKNIQNTLHVPVGIIASSWGGIRIEPWTPPAAYAALPAFKTEAAQAKIKIDGVEPGKYFFGMIAPLAPFALKGFLWYQGESNCMIHDNVNLRYADKMQALIEGWRNTWQNNELPFYSVLIAPYYYTKRKDKLPHTPETLPEFWEAQIQSIKISNTNAAVVTDLVDNLANIHPSYKWEVGRRLSLLALNNTYEQKNVVCNGPVLQKAVFKRRKVVLSFANADGLHATDGQPLNWFSIAKDTAFVSAEAEIKGNTITLTAKGLKHPKIARFAWNETAQPNLANAAGLPAFPFRTNSLEWKYQPSTSILKQ